MKKVVSSMTLLALDESLQEAVLTAIEWYRTRDRARFCVELPNQRDRTTTALATINELLHPWERAILLTNQPVEEHHPAITLITPTDLSTLDMSVEYAMLMIDQAQGEHARLYQKLIRAVLHPYGLCVAYTDDYRRERAVLDALFTDGLAYFTDTDAEFERGMRFYRKAVKDRSFGKPQPVASKQVFALDKYEQDIVWDELVGAAGEQRRAG